MSFNERKELLKTIEEHRKRPLLVYITSGRANAGGSIANDVIREFVEQIDTLPDDTKSLDLIINSFGGDGVTSWRLTSLIREKIGQEGDYTVMVPYYAFSAATLIALGANNIYMHPFSCLGPVDPQINVTKEDGKTRTYAYEDILSYGKFLKEDGQISDESQFAPLFQKLVEEIDPSILGKSKRSSKLSITLASRLLKMHMKGDKNEKKADTIAKTLNKSYFSHGHAVSRSEAKELNLSICDDDPKLNDLIWQVFKNIEDEMKMNEPFDILGLCLAEPGNEFLTEPPPEPAVPANMPPQILQNYWVQYANSQISTKQSKPVDYENIIAIIESLRYRSVYKKKGRVFALRQPNMEYLLGNPVFSSLWESEKIQKPSNP